jgi:hypothetical protein
MNNANKGKAGVAVVALLIAGGIGRSCGSKDDSTPTPEPSVQTVTVDQDGRVVETSVDGVPVEPTVVTPSTLPDEIPVVEGTPIPDANTPTSALTLDEVPRIELGPQGLVLTGSNKPGNGTVVTNTDIALIGVNAGDAEDAIEYEAGEPLRFTPGETKAFNLDFIDNLQDDGRYEPDVVKEALAGNGQIVKTVEAGDGLVTTIGPPLGDGMIIE